MTPVRRNSKYLRATVGETPDITTQQERRRQCVQDVQSAKQAAAGETVDVEIYKSGYEGMGDIVVWAERCCYGPFVPKLSVRFQIAKMRKP